MLDNSLRQWFEEAYKESGWDKSEAPFGNTATFGPSGPTCGPDDPEACAATSAVDTDAPEAFCDDEEEQRRTVYFRRDFQVSDPNAYASYNLFLLADDGAVVYINGVEVLRAFMPPLPATVDRCTLALPTRRPLGLYIGFPIAASDLQIGENSLEVEVHRHATETAGLAFDLELVGGNPQ